MFFVDRMQRVYKNAINNVYQVLYIRLSITVYNICVRKQYKYIYSTCFLKENGVN